MKTGKLNPLKVGDKFTTNEGYTVVVTSYENAHKVKIEYENGYSRFCSSSDIRKGKVKNYYHPSVYGVGFLGEGNHRASIGRKHTEAYKTWKSMLRRCYSDDYQIEKPSYIGCSVDPEWHNFQNFADWFYSNYVEGWSLDKDILHAGNKIYSKSTAVFVPRHVNSQVVDQAVQRGLYPVGVTRNYNKYHAKIRVDMESVLVGIYKTQEEAQAAYSAAKREEIKRVISLYPQLTEETKRALLSRTFTE